MPTKKTSAKPIKKFVKKTNVSPKKQNSAFLAMLEYLRFGESYTSLVLGIIVVIIATVFLLIFVHNRQSNKPNSDVFPTVVQSQSLAISPSAVMTQAISSVPTATPKIMPTQTPVISGKTYTVVANDSLWKIAEKVYGSGYKWVDIAKANKLSDPSDIHVGNKLALPQISSPFATVHTNDDDMATSVAPSIKINGFRYTIVHGDDLWDIAVRAYGDGYQWTKIAKANNITNPDVIHAGNVITIPRN